MKRVKDIYPNIKPTQECLLFVDYVCVDHYPFHHSELVGRSLSDVCALLGIMHIPDDCNFVFYRRKDCETTFREYGVYTLLFNSKPLLSIYVQNSPSRN